MITNNRVEIRVERIMNGIIIVWDQEFNNYFTGLYFVRAIE
jgi:hypothetical protein